MLFEGRVYPYSIELTVMVKCSQYATCRKPLLLNELKVTVLDTFGVELAEDEIDFIINNDQVFNPKHINNLPMDLLRLLVNQTWNDGNPEHEITRLIMDSYINNSLNLTALGKTTLLESKTLDSEIFKTIYSKLINNLTGTDSDISILKEAEHYFNRGEPLYGFCDFRRHVMVINRNKI